MDHTMMNQLDTSTAFALQLFAASAHGKARNDADIAEAFRDSMACFPAAVSIVTTGKGKYRRGFTATAVMSVSMAPPMIAVCVNKNVDAHPHLLGNGDFCVNVLSKDQEGIANRFAARDGSKGAVRFTFDEWDQLETGAPALAGCLSSVDCSLAAGLDAGTHTLMVGRVLAVRNAATRPLLYFNRHFAGAHILANAGVPAGLAPIDGW